MVLGQISMYLSSNWNSGTSPRSDIYVFQYFRTQEHLRAQHQGGLKLVIIIPKTGTKWSFKIGELNLKKIVTFFKTKELSVCHTLWFSNSYNLAIHSPKPLIFQTINSVRSNSLNLKFTPSGCEVKGIRKFKFVAKTQLL